MTVKTATATQEKGLKQLDTLHIPLQSLQATYTTLFAPALCILPNQETQPPVLLVAFP
jgi:hypothetical protein